MLPIGVIKMVHSKKTDYAMPCVMCSSADRLLNCQLMALLGPAFIWCKILMTYNFIGYSFKSIV